MRMKEDHRKNAQLKPANNVQIGAENQFVVGFSVHQRPADIGCLVPRREQIKTQLGHLPASGLWMGGRPGRAGRPVDG
jgi:hypothetical protein